MKKTTLISQLGLSTNNLDSVDAFRQEANISCNFLEWSGLNTERAYKRSAVCTLLASFAPIMAGIGGNNGGFLQRSLSL